MEKTIALKEKTVNKVTKFARRIIAYATVTACTLSSSLVAHASGFDAVTISNADVDAAAMMGKVIGIIVTITRYAGVGLAVYGVVEIVMAYMQQQPEAKTKGIIMLLCGAVMFTIKSVLKWLGVIA